MMAFLRYLLGQNLSFCDQNKTCFISIILNKIRILRAKVNSGYGFWSGFQRPREGSEERIEGGLRVADRRLGAVAGAAVRLWRAGNSRPGRGARGGAVPPYRAPYSQP